MDLVTGKDVFLRDQFLKNSTEVTIQHLNDFLSVLAVGEKYKKFAETKMNTHSSRSHTIIIVNISQSSVHSNKIVNSSLYLVDLAGCEQIKKSEVVGMNRVEAISINMSLLSLGKCISALVKNEKHIPYYDSRLTQLLKSCFGGNSRT